MLIFMVYLVYKFISEIFHFQLTLGWIDSEVLESILVAQYSGISESTLLFQDQLPILYVMREGTKQRCQTCPVAKRQEKQKISFWIFLHIINLV